MAVRGNPYGANASLNFSIDLMFTGSGAVDQAGDVAEIDVLARGRQATLGGQFEREVRRRRRVRPVSPRPTAP